MSNALLESNAQLEQRTAQEQHTAGATHTQLESNAELQHNSCAYTPQLLSLTTPLSTSSASFAVLALCSCHHHFSSSPLVYISCCSLSHSHLTTAQPYNTFVNIIILCLLRSHTFVNIISLCPLRSHPSVLATAAFLMITAHHHCHLFPLGLCLSSILSRSSTLCSHHCFVVHHLLHQHLYTIPALSNTMLLFPIMTVCVSVHASFYFVVANT